MLIHIIWDVPPNLVDKYQRFRDIFCLNRQGTDMRISYLMQKSPMDSYFLYLSQIQIHVNH
jgi:hypothetical protein